MPSPFCPQVLSRHGEGVCFQLLLLAGSLPHFHHGHNTDQHLLSRLPGGLFLLYVVWRQRPDAAGQVHPATVGLAHWVHLLCDCYEESAVCKLLHHEEVQWLCFLKACIIYESLFFAFLSAWFLCLPGQPGEEQLLVNSGL